MRGALLAAILLAALQGCRSNREATTSAAHDSSEGTEPSTPASDEPASPTMEGSDEPAAQAAEGNRFLPSWCARAAPDPYETLYRAATTYFDSQVGACSTTKLTQALSAEQTVAWVNYLVDYSHALAGCDIPDPSLGGRGFLPGGVGQFGPANLAAVDAPQPRLGRNDASLLIDEYLSAFASALRLSDGERQGVRLFLEGTAEAQIEPMLSGVLSACDAGASGG